MKSKELFLGMTFVLFSALCSSLGQLVWKLMTLNNLSPYYYVFGLCLYGLGALLLIVAFRFGEMSVLHPMLSFGFVFAMVWSVIILGENITPQKITGIILIIAGVIFLAFGDGESKRKCGGSGGIIR